MRVFARLRLFGIILLLAGCTGAPVGGIEPPKAGPGQPATDIPTRLPTATRLVATRRPAQPRPTPVTNVPIEIDGRYTHTTITPRHVARILITDAPVMVQVHYPGSLDGRQVDASVRQPASVYWSVQVSEAPDPNTATFGLLGAEPGFFTVQVTADGYAPVIFGIQAGLPPTAGPGTPATASTPAATALATPLPTTGTAPIVVGTSVPSISGPIVSSAVPGTGSTTPPTATPQPGSASGQRTVTIADNGSTLTLQVGERFLLALGEGYDWQVTPGDPTIISRVVNIPTIQGSQGLYEAHKAGQTMLTANGDPSCSKAQPPCMMPSRLFQLQIIVQ